MEAQQTKFLIKTNQEYVKYWVQSVINIRYIGQTRKTNQYDLKNTIENQEKSPNAKRLSETNHNIIYQIHITNNQGLNIRKAIEINKNKNIL